MLAYVKEVNISLEMLEADLYPVQMREEKELSDYHTENILQLARSKEFLQVKDNLFGDKNQAVIKKLNKIKTEKIESREFLIKLKEAFNFTDKKTSDYVSNGINNSRFTLRLSDYSVNADYVSDKYIETSIVIRLSYNEFKKSG